MPDILLAAPTDGSNDDAPLCFLLALPPEIARTLLKWGTARDAAETAAGDSVYCVELFCSFGDWGDLRNTSPCVCDWSALSDWPKLYDKPSVELETVKVVEDGVIFSATWDGDTSGTYFATPPLPWDVIRLVAAEQPVPASLLPHVTVTPKGDEDEDKS